MLLQAFISQLKLEGFALMADMVYVTQVRVEAGDRVNTRISTQRSQISCPGVAGAPGHVPNKVTRGGAGIKKQRST